MEIEIRTHHFVLLPQKAIYWKEEETLLVSDLHVGKITHFRKEGIAVPRAATEANFRRLDEILKHCPIRRMLILGDVFHNRYNKEWDTFRIWRAGHPDLEVILVAGNHDVLPETLYNASRIRLIKHTYNENGFAFVHKPAASGVDTFTFSGHIHPVHFLRGKGRQGVRFPCFVVDPLQAVLPSFGVFTGGYEMLKKPERKIFVIAGREVLEV